MFSDKPATTLNTLTYLPDFRVFLICVLGAFTADAHTDLPLTTSASPTL